MNKKIQILQVWLFDGIKWVIKNNNTKTESVSAIPLNRWNIKDSFGNIIINRTELLKDGEVIAENVNNYILCKDDDNRGKVVDYQNGEYVIINKLLPLDDNLDPVSNDNRLFRLIDINDYQNGYSKDDVYVIEAHRLVQESFIISNMPSCSYDMFKEYKKWVNTTNHSEEVEIIKIVANRLYIKTCIGDGYINVIDFEDKYTPIDMIDDKSTDKRKHSHYYKDVRHLDYIDIYRFCDLFLENDPSGALHHAIKKLAAAGRRGAGKDEVKDLKEAVDTINRKIEMLEEDKLKAK